MLKDFIAFLKEYNIVSLTMAFIMGAASTSLVNSLVKDIIMPIFSPLTSSGDWQNAVLNLGPISIKYGSFLGELLNFIVLGLVIFIIAKKILKMDAPK
ncbi:MAG TPA: MscL family protein [Candidatus Pacearchaeota archaeon]|nr:MscL family protein [Candidatus Pacearchaeota archaeon]HPR79941.1 MscL family protein [Candidatus Pacearchaeota archaeon]